MSMFARQQNLVSKIKDNLFCIIFSINTENSMIQKCANKTFNTRNPDILAKMNYKTRITYMQKIKCHASFIMSNELKQTDFYYMEKSTISFSFSETITQCLQCNKTNKYGLNVSMENF